MTAIEAATIFNANNPGHFPGRPLFEGLVQKAIDAERNRIKKIIRDHERAHELGTESAMHGVTCFQILLALIGGEDDE